VTVAGRVAPHECAPVSLVLVLLALAGGCTSSKSASDGSTIAGTTPHLTFMAVLSEEGTAARPRASIRVDVMPKKGMHVYAPGTYQAIEIRIPPHDGIQVHDLVYPEATTYFFEPLQERVPVYDRPLQLVIDLTVARAGAWLGWLRGRSTLSITGTLEYQACDDRVCYLPESVPLEWRVS
jgi:hypothetical protein